MPWIVAGRDMDLLELSAYGNVRRGQDSGGCNIQWEGSSGALTCCGQVRKRASTDIQRFTWWTQYLTPFIFGAKFLLAVLNHSHISQLKWNGLYALGYIDGLMWPTLALVIAQFWSSDGIFNNPLDHLWQFAKIYLQLKQKKNKKNAIMFCQTSFCS